MKTLFLAWRDPEKATWYPVGRLTFDGSRYRFVYTGGARRLRDELRFQPINGFRDLYKVYESEELFAVFKNRLLPPSRADYLEFLNYLGVTAVEENAMAILEITEGRRETDTYEVFSPAVPDEKGESHLSFFAHGLRHLAKDSLRRIEQLEAGDPLLLMWDFQNPHDPFALLLRTNDKYVGDRYIVGFCPRYLLDDIHAAITQELFSMKVEVERVNRPPAPLQFRLRCRMHLRWPAGYVPFASEDYVPLVEADPKM